MKFGSIQKKLAAVCLAAAAVAAVLITYTSAVSAVATGTVPDSSAIVPSGYTFDTGYINAEWTINDAYKNVITVMDKRSGEGCISFVVAKNDSSTKTYTDPLTVIYRNAGKINGRYVDIKLNVDKLVREGYLERREAPDDRRKTLLFCTEKAQDVIEKGRMIQSIFKDTLLDGTDETSKEIFFHMLHVMERNMDNILKGDK